MNHYALKPFNIPDRLRISIFVEPNTGERWQFLLTPHSEPWESLKITRARNNEVVICPNWIISSDKF